MSRSACLIYAHRGAHGGDPENTLYAIRRSLAAGAPALEIDVHRVGDELMVIHDRRLERRTDGNGPLTEYTFEDLRKLTAGAGETIPTLAEVLALVDARAILNVELKGPRTAEPVALALNACVESGRWRREQFIVSSFNHRELLAFGELAPGIPLAMLCEGVLVDMVHVARTLKAGTVHLSLDFTDAALVAELQRAGLKVAVYTVNQPDDMRRLLKVGVDALITDELELARQVCREEGRAEPEDPETAEQRTI